MGKAEEAGYGSAAVPDKTSRNPFRRFMNGGNHNEQQQRLGTDEYKAPPGPPPGPPPSQKQWQQESSDAEQYQPPPGPPPAFEKRNEQDESAPPPYDPWLTVPDNSSLPPPPGISYEMSPTSNASGDMAEIGRSFTYNNPLHTPRQLRDGELAEIRSGHVALTRPPNVSRVMLDSSRPGTWHVRAPRGTQDGILPTSLPAYAAAHHNPSATGAPYTAYFEVKCIRFEATNIDSELDAMIGIGFVAPPYPPFRLPGWDRASLGVHSDDGRRYVYDNRGGRDFTTFFQEGDVVGIGMRFSPPFRYGDGPQVEVFFTRNGRKEGSWDLWEDREIREEDLGNPYGLGGDRDLIAAVGISGAVEFEWRGRRDEWLYRPDLNR